MKESDSFSVLLVDDEPKILHSYQSMLTFEGINNVMCCIDSRNVIDILTRHPIGVVVLDLSMPH
ncbi:response regulator, partial [Arthrospira platensis SPKY1]|nr:response regulator [Arthrospira platensis SPKY1]